MYIDFGMNDNDLKGLIHDIDVKHQSISVKDRYLANRLGELFEGIYSDFNQGAHAFGMFKGLFIKKENENPEQDYFAEGAGNSIPNQIIVHSLFTNSLMSLRRIIDESRDWKKYCCIKNIQYKVENEIKKKIPHNQEVLGWFDILEKKYEDAKSRIEPLLTYIDDRVAHHNRKWDKRLVQSTARDIETAFNSINAYNNAFRVFYNSGESITMIPEGERHAALFLRVYYGCKRYNELRNAVIDLEISEDFPEDHQKSLASLKHLVFR